VAKKKKGDLIGRTVGNFVIEELLGEGGMGAVYGANHTALGTKAVVKVMHSHLAQDETQAMRFLNEARLASSLQQANIVRIYDFGTLDEGEPYMIMEYIPGVDLADILEDEERLDPMRAVNILRQVALALECAHTDERGAIVHRDLKPQNIRISQRAGDDHATVLDFGIARTVDTRDAAKVARLTMPGTLVGTPAYMSPEQAMGVRLDGRSDLYALGVVAYEMLTGKIPFEGNSLVALIAAHIQEEPPQLPEDLPVPEGLRKLVHWLLQKDPDDRPQSAREVVNHLDEYLEELKSRALRRRVKMIVSTAFLLTVVAVGAAIFYSNKVNVEPALLDLEARVTTLTAGPLDLMGREAIYTREASLDIRGALAFENEENADNLRVSLKDQAGETLDRDLPEGGRFMLKTGDLPVAQQTAISVVLDYEGPDGSDRTRLLSGPHAITRDQTPPSIALKPPTTPGARLDAAAGTLRTQVAKLSMPLAITDEAPLLSEGFKVAVAPAGSGTIERSADGATLELDLSEASDGLLQVTLFAEDQAGNRGEKTFETLLDRAAPRLTIASVGGLPAPESGSWVLPVDAHGEHTVPVKVGVIEPGGVDQFEVSVTPEGGPTASVPARLAAAGAEAQEVEGTVPVPLSTEGAGVYTIRVRATDTVGHEAHAEAKVRLIVALAATVSVDLPDGEGGRVPVAEGAAVYTRAGAARVAVTANQPLDGGVARIDPDGGDPAEVTLGPGENGAALVGDVALVTNARQQLTVTVRAEAGDRTEVRTIVQDQLPPNLVLEGAAWASAIGQSSARVSGNKLDLVVKVSDSSPGIEVRVLSGTGAPGEIGSMRQALERGERPPDLLETEARVAEDGRVAVPVPIVDGEDVVVGFVAIDAAGNKSYLARSASVDLAPPEIRLGTLRSYKIHEPWELTFEIPEEASNVRVNGTGAGLTRSGNRYVLKGGPMLADTPTRLTIEARDRAGNQAKLVVNLTREAICVDAGEPLDLAKLRASGATFCPHCTKPIVKE
jgi:tRNA A-37 threonylcarbamoyl transferase component Bud32